MAEKGSPAATSVAERELTITRRFEAPRELVFRAWTEPDRVLQWLPNQPQQPTRPNRRAAQRPKRWADGL